MVKNLVEHEEINLHIRKTIFYEILRSIIIIPLAIYLIASQWAGANIRWVCSGWDCIQWFDLGILLNSFVLSIIIIIVGIFLIVNGFYIRKYL